MMKSYFAASICLVVLVVALNLVNADQEHQVQQHQQQHQLSNDEYKNRLVKLLLSDVESSSSSDDESDAAESDEESENQMDKRMSYRYGKRMSYRYGKRSAMPYRFGKRANAYAYPSAQHILEYIKMHENDDDSSFNKRMSYRYGRSAN